MVLKVLYVEDDLGSRNVFSMAQRMNPDLIDATIYEDSQKFEEKLLGLNPLPNLIVLDIHVKPYTGFEMLEIIRRHKQFDAIPVIALTASVMNEEVQMLREVGFQGVFSKPLDLDSFPDLIKRVMQGEKIWYVWW